MDYSEIVKVLRNKSILDHIAYANEAVTAIETLLAERDAAVLDLHYMHALCMKFGFSCPECDSRIDDLLMSACAFCKNREMACWKDGRCGDFEWRGPRKWFLPQKGNT